MDIKVLTVGLPDATGTYEETLTDAVDSSGGTGDAGKLVLIGSSGTIDPSFLPETLADFIPATNVTYDRVGYSTVESALNALFTGVAGTLTFSVDGTVLSITAEPTGGGGPSILLPLPATDISYDYPGFPSVEAALNKLFYIPLTGTISNDQNTLEIGTVVTEVTLTWAYNAAVTTQVINQGVGALASSLRTYQVLYSPGITGNITYTLTATDGTTTITPSTSISFYPKVYWGVNPNLTLTTAQILALGNSTFATGFARSMIYNATGGNYPYYCYPTYFGSPNTVTVGGLAFSDYTLVSQSFTNAVGYTQNYNVIRFNNLQNGSGISVAWS